MKTKQLVIRVTEEQYKSIQENAALQNKKPTQYARDILFPDEQMSLTYKAIIDLRYKYLSLRTDSKNIQVRTKANMKIALLDEIITELPSLLNN